MASFTRAQASPEPLQTKEPQEGEPVFYETTTVLARPVASATSSVTVVAADAIEASAARSVNDALRQVPGLDLLASSGRAGVTNAFIRGGDPNFTLVLLDGIPLNDGTELKGGAVNLEELPAVFLERLEVVRGPRTSFYGPGSMAGVVQLFTRRGGPGPTRLALGAEAGSAQLRHGFARVSGPARNGGYFAGASWDHERGRVGEDRYRALDVGATWDRSFGLHKNLGVTGRVAAGEAHDYPDSSGGPGYGSGELRRTERLDLAFGAQIGVGDPALRRHRLTLAVARRGLDRTSPVTPPLVPASTGDTAFTRLRLGYETSLLRKARTSFDLGVSGEGEWAGNASVLHLPPEQGGDVPGDYHNARVTGGAYLGVRHERRRLLLEAALRVDAVKSDAVQPNPQVGFLWRVDGGWTTRLHGTVGRASKLPSFFALSSPRQLGGNPDLEPERAFGGDVGVDRSFASGRLALGATVFRHDYRDLVDFDFELFQSVNRTRVRTQGMEITLRMRPAAAVAFDADATWLEARDLSGGASLLHRPRWRGAGSLSCRPSKRLSLQLNGRTVSRYRDFQFPVPHLDTVVGYAVLGLAGSWQLTDRWMIRARIDNLAARAYETYIGFPGPGRSVWLGLGWQRQPNSELAKAATAEPLSR